ncbi:hypothetical protein AAGT00_00475 (plasmid) [Streptomyces cavourensis]
MEPPVGDANGDGEDAGGTTRAVPVHHPSGAPSTVSRVRVDRYSPYFEKPEEFRIALNGPEPKYRFIHAVPAAEQTALAYSFDHTETEERADADEMLALRRRLGARVGLWKKLHAQSRFAYRLGPDLTVLQDHRPHVATGRHVLRGADNQLFRSMAHGGRIDQTVERVSDKTGLPQAELRGRLQTWSRRGWLHIEARRGLILATRDGMPDELGRAAELRDDGLVDKLRGHDGPDVKDAAPDMITVADAGRTGGDSHG